MLASLIALLASANSEVVVTSVPELRKAVIEAKPGTRILVAPGEYAGGLHFTNIHGQEGNFIVIAAADPAKPPVFKGGGSTLQFSDISYVELRNLIVRGGAGNGLNIDDGGTMETPSHHVNLVGIQATDLPPGNHDAIKLSGLDDFSISGCKVERWGGSGIDMVGCHRGLIQYSTFRDGGSSGIQAKGGTSDIVVRGCRFENYGERAVNLGGSTGMAFFRPPIEKMVDGKYEARDLTVESCTFVGGTAPIAYVGSVNATVRFNTIYHPKRWAIRILQETNAVGFLPCMKGVFSDNLIVFRSDQWFSGGLNVGGGTKPETFSFARNFWYCSDQPSLSKPTLPVVESGGVYGTDPLLIDPASGNFDPKPGSPAAAFGAVALTQKR